MHGWTGRVLHVDLGTGMCRAESPPREVYETWIGGRALAGVYLAERITEPWDSPAMPLLFFTGPLVGTAAPTPGRMAVASRSPLTGTACDASVGGSLGVQLKRAGWDGIVVTGRGARLGGLEVADGEARVVDAAAMAGWETGRVLEALGGEGSAAVVGPAAERGVLFAGIRVDRHHFAGRGGLGAVMAAKNLKYVRVRGTGRTEVKDREELLKAREEILRLTATSPVLQGELGLIRYGTPAVYDLMDSRRMMPTDNFRATRFEGARALNAWELHRRYEPEKHGCAGCHIRCKMQAKDGRTLPEFETLSHFTALIGNRDLEAVVSANRICNELGMDTISAGGTLACWREVTGRELDREGIAALLGEIAARRGEGEELALGAARFAAGRGRPETAMAVKGLEMPAYDPRGAYGMALSYAVSSRGGCHLRAYPVAHEILRKPVATDRFSFAGKGRMVKLAEDANAAVDSLTACKFLFFAASLEEYARAFQGATGVATTGQDLLRAGERACYRERIMNARNGFSAADDDLPARFFAEPGTSGEGITVAPIDREGFLAARAAYYKVRGLDGEGRPRPEKAAALGVPWNA